MLGLFVGRAWWLLLFSWPSGVPAVPSYDGALHLHPMQKACHGARLA